MKKQDIQRVCKTIPFVKRLALKGRLSLTGFTLTELILVIVIIGILAIVLLPRTDAVPGVRLGSAATKIASDLRYAQRLAQSRHDIFGIAFYPGQDRYDIFEGNDTTSFVRDPQTQGDFRVYLNQGNYAGVGITTASFDGASVIQFDSSGGPLRGDTGDTMESPGVIEISNSSATRTLNVEPETGWVSY